MNEEKKHQDPTSSGTTTSKFRFAGTDVLAALVIAALTIPLALGYAEIAGVPARYGLYAAVVATLVYSIISPSRHIVFSLDSATSAVVGSSMVTLGVAMGSEEAVGTMVAITLVAGAFLILFSFIKAGVLADLVPTPVLHGFILGVSVLIILHQLPTMFGVSMAFSGDIARDAIAVSAAIPPQEPWAFYMSFASLIVLVVLHRAAPRIPGAIIVLLAATAATCVMGACGISVPCVALGEGAQLPLPVIPDVSGWDAAYIVRVVAAGLGVAVVSGIESLLCLDMFKSHEGVLDSNHELACFGVADMVSALFGCPVSSASVSRTAANIESGGKTRSAAAASALIILAVVLFAAPLLAYVPRCALSAIVVFAIMRLIDYRKIRRYYNHMPSELVVLVVSAFIVLVFGAIAGVAGGAALSILVHFLRKWRSKDEVELGVEVVGKNQRKAETCEAEEETLSKCPTLSLMGDLTFYNVPRRIERFERTVAGIADRSLPIIIDLTDVESVDASATDALLQLIDWAKAAGRTVKIVRGMHVVSDEYTRYELGRVLEDADVYPDAISAVSGVKQKHFKIVEKDDGA